MALDLILPPGTPDGSDQWWAAIVEAHLLHDLDHRRALARALSAVEPPAAIRAEHDELVVATRQRLDADERYARDWQQSVAPDFRLSSPETERATEELDARHQGAISAAEERSAAAFCALQDLARDLGIAFTAGCPRRSP